MNFDDIDFDPEDSREFRFRDPDTIYYYAKDPITFIFVPPNKMFTDQYPETHEDLLAKKDVRYAVYGALPSRWSRSSALHYAILGRAVVHKDHLYVSTWQGDINPKPYAQEIVNQISKELPNYQFVLFKTENQEIIEVQPNSIGKTSSTSKTNQSYLIDGKSYSIKDLNDKRIKAHMGQIDPILCHPDLDKYPELSGYKPSTCNKTSELRNTHPQNWRRQSQDSYLYKYGESFKNWFLNEVAKTPDYVVEKIVEMKFWQENPFWEWLATFPVEKRIQIISSIYRRNTDDHDRPPLQAMIAKAIKLD